jgi:hypothetical protein
MDTHGCGIAAKAVHPKKTVARLQGNLQIGYPAKHHRSKKICAVSKNCSRHFFLLKYILYKIIPTRPVPPAV